jgi:hypothetical protein
MRTHYALFRGERVETYTCDRTELPAAPRAVRARAPEEPQACVPPSVPLFLNARTPIPYLRSHLAIARVLSDSASLTAIYELSAFQRFAFRLLVD